MNTVTFTPNIVRGVLLKLKPSTSSGYDCIPNVFLKNVPIPLLLRCATFLMLRFWTVVYLKLGNTLLSPLFIKKDPRLILIILDPYL